MRLILDYIKSAVRTLILVGLLLGLFLLLGWICGVDRGGMLYFMALCLSVSLGWFALDFWRFFKKDKRLKLLQGQILLSLENLPRPENRIEEDYQQLIFLQSNDRRTALNAQQLSYGEMLDYFTLWAHQIKTPISAMGLIMQSEPERYGEELEQELFRIEQYVDMVLSFLRLDSDYTDFVLKSYSIDTIIKGSVRKYAKQFIRKRISLVYEGTELCCVTDEKWLGFVLEQLLANALKYTYSGSIAVTVEGTCIIIQDSGIGIAPEDLPRIFEKGYTGYNGRTGQKSTGIGLYLCKRILTKLGHEIKVESKPGEGTKVTIELECEDNLT